MAEVSKQSTEAEPLFVVDGKVYALRLFLESHPGGDDVLLEHHGRDVSTLMRSPEHPHSHSAFALLQDFWLADLIDYNKYSVVESDDACEESAVLADAVAFEETQTTSSTTTTTTTTSTSTTKLPAIDFQRPIFGQIWALNMDRDTYVRFVHTPHHLPHIARFFANPLLELFSRNPWWVIPFVWIPVTLFMLREEAQLSIRSPMLFLVMLSFYLVGFVIWTLLEYALHRFLFHMDDRLPNYRIAMMLHFTLHGVHHFLPMDKMRLVFPPVMAVPIVYAIHNLFCFTFGLRYGAVVTAGGISGYMVYDLFHYFLHHGKIIHWLKQHSVSSATASSGTDLATYMTRMKTYHMDHHYKDYHEGYGITTKFWDHVFGTAITPVMTIEPFPSNATMTTTTAAAAPTATIKKMNAGTLRLRH